MSLWVTRLLTRLDRYSSFFKSNTMCPIVECSAGEEYEPKAGHVICVSFWIEFKKSYPSFHLKDGKQDWHITCLKHINLTRTWLCCWKVDNAILHAGFCLRVGRHERLITTAEFRNAVKQCMLLESFDCRSQSTSRMTGRQIV